MDGNVRMSDMSTSWDLNQCAKGKEIGDGLKDTEAENDV